MSSPSSRIDTDKSPGAIANRPLWLVQRLAEISSQLDESVETEKVMKKIRFLCYELNANLPLNTDKLDRLNRLKEFFFATKKFTTKSEDETDTADDHLIHRVLARRSGSPLTVGLIFRALAEHVGLQIDLVDLGDGKFLRFVENGQSHFFDLLNGGIRIPKNEFLNRLNLAYSTGKKKSVSFLEDLDAEQILFRHLNNLKNVYLNNDSESALLKVLNMTLSLRSRDLRALAERALLKEKMGACQEAFLDLKRYFSFRGEQESPPELLAIYRKLKSELMRT